MHKRPLAAALLSTSLLFFVFISSGCGEKLGDEPTKYVSQEGLEKLSTQAQAARDNPKFLSAKNITPNSATSKDIDLIIRPVLVKTFKDARLVSDKGPEAPRRDGEVVEDRIIYSVKTLLAKPDGDKLHSAFRSAGFAASPRLGSKPTHARDKTYMSLMRTTRQRGYSFVIVVDPIKQQIEVESYRLGSKYDRML